jgi:ParB family transcriptional regulator, chromosome partitioning protein
MPAPKGVTDSFPGAAFVSGLHRGFVAVRLLSQSSWGFFMTEDQIELVPIEKIDRPGVVARDTIDPEKVRELAESIREMGLRQPVLLRPVNGRYETVAGDRRYLAHKLLGLKEIKAIVREMDDRECFLVRATENLQRENLTASEEARTYVDMRDKLGFGVMEIAKRTGKSPQTIKRYMDFSKLPDDVKRAVDQKRVSLSTVETLCEIDDPEAFKYFFEMASANGVTDKVARLWVDDYEKTKNNTYHSEGGGTPNLDLAIEAKPVYITCEACHGPCEIKLVRNVVMCPDCRKKLQKV